MYRTGRNDVGLLKCFTALKEIKFYLTSEFSV